jgi:hypothetical protein
MISTPFSRGILPVRSGVEEIEYREKFATNTSEASVPVSITSSLIRGTQQDSCSLKDPWETSQGLRSMNRQRRRNRETHAITATDNQESFHTTTSVVRPPATSGEVMWASYVGDLGLSPEWLTMSKIRYPRLWWTLSLIQRLCIFPFDTQSNLFSLGHKTIIFPSALTQRTIFSPSALMQSKILDVTRNT